MPAIDQRGYTRSRTRCCNEPRTSSSLFRKMGVSIGRTRHQPHQIEWPKPRRQLQQSHRHSCWLSSRIQSIRSVASSRSHPMRQFAIRLEPANILAPCVAHTDSHPAITSTHCHVTSREHTMRLTPSIISISPLCGQCGPLLQNAGQTCSHNSVINSGPARRDVRRPATEHP